MSCACGTTFKAEIYRTVNVTQSPQLSFEIEAGSLNYVTCPACGVAWQAPSPFLYHDMASELRVWVYPVARIADEVLIREKIQRAAQIAYSIAPRPETSHVPPSALLVFGLQSLRDLLKGRRAVSADPNETSPGAIRTAST